MTIKELEQEPCEDAISKQEVLELVADYNLSMGQVVKGIHALPLVTPKQKTGHWYDKWGKDGCSVCNEGIDDAQTFDGRPFKYCPMCGARMEKR